MTQQLVIARYNEDVQWLKDVNLDTVVYNKGNDFNLQSIKGCKDKLQEFKLPNVGRESHTLLHHIIKNYDDLCNTTIFLQANPFDHLGNFHAQYPNVELTNFLNNLPEQDELFGFGIYHTDIGYMTERENMFAELNIQHRKHGNEFSVGCQYILPKKVILRKPVEFYQKLQLWHEDTSSRFYHVHLPCIIERTWLDIFDSNDANFTNI